MIRSLTSEEHDNALAHGMAVLVFRVAESPACQQFHSELEEFDRRKPGCAIWTVEAMDQRDLSELHNLRSLPSIMIYRDGIPLRRYAGVLSADDLVEEFDELATADRQAEISDWMLEMMETGEAGSPAVSAIPR